jgi:hypothetical protein
MLLGAVPVWSLWLFFILSAGSLMQICLIFLLEINLMEVG